MKNKTLLSVCLALIVSVVPAVYAAETLPDTLSRPAQMSPLAARSMLSDVARAGERLVAVGERGHIVYSDDEGESWTQSPSPVSVTLTGVCFNGPNQGWAVGHRGVILRTGDAGVSWELQLDGLQLAKSLLAEAQKQASRMESSAEFLVEDGADKPLLDIACLGRDRAVAVGAYGLGAMTQDGGDTWKPMLALLETSDQSHINTVQAVSDDLFMAGEMGGLYRSQAFSANAVRLSQPYEGSYFGLLAQGSQLYAFGLRGHLFTSSDQGQQWSSLDVGTRQSLTAGALLGPGKALFVDATGAGWLTRDAGQRFKRVTALQSFPISQVLPMRDGSVLAVGLRGVTRFSADQFD